MCTGVVWLVIGPLAGSKPMGSVKGGESRHVLLLWTSQEGLRGVRHRNLPFEVCCSRGISDSLIDCSLEG